ncbi:hypothetical protein A9Q98_14880 [Thalassotalea sp. 42_200_T64]|nr:hypothetical protein A9Q98_14880 [Thalassotalea sp. 42_200_T64]
MNDDIENQITQLTKVLYGQGTSTEFGCSDEDVDTMKAFCQKLEPYKPYCVVKHWTIWDIQTPVITEGKHPPMALIKADHILDDELQRFPVGGWVRSTAIVEIYKNCIFRTNNSSYILVGSGTRKNVDLDDVGRFF